MTLCGMDCCKDCELYKSDCMGCEETNGHPCGGDCTAAECVRTGGLEAMEKQKSDILARINALNIPGLTVTDLNLLNGNYVNLEYSFPSGMKAKLLRDDKIYWANQIEREGSDRCYGIAADDEYILVCEYGCMGADPKIIAYLKK